MNRQFCRPRYKFTKTLSSVTAAGVLLLLLGRFAAAAPAAGNYLPDITLKNQNGQSLSLASLRGKPVLVGFIHTMCKGPCEMLTTKMQSVSSAIPAMDSRNATMLLITTDPNDDQPPQLRAFAKKMNVTGSQWILATGSSANIKRVMQAYGVSHQDDDDDAMIHVMKLFLIAPDGTLAHTYSGLNASPQTVAGDIVKLSHQEHAATQRVSLTQ
jgi:protein SCO1